MTKEKLLSTKEAAAYLGLSEVSLRRWRCANRGPSYHKLGAHVRYKQRDLEEWVERRKQVTKDDSAA